MQSELLRLTEALQVAAHQIVLTSDRPRGEIADLDERLISRFSGGLVGDIGPPDYETRVAILRRKAEERAARFAPGVLETVAGAAFDNVRELMGALNRLVAYQAVNETQINAATAKQLLGLKAEAAVPAGAPAPRGAAPPRPAAGAARPPAGPRPGQAPPAGPGGGGGARAPRCGGGGPARPPP